MRNSDANSRTRIVRKKIEILSRGLKVTPQTLRATAERLEAHIPRPSVLDYLIPPVGCSGPSLFCPSENPGVPRHPEAYFRWCRESDVPHGILPDAWSDADLYWVKKLGWGTEFAEAEEINRLNLQAGTYEFGPWSIPDYPASAGALCYVLNPPPESPMRQLLLTSACAAPAGAYFSIEAMTSPDDRPALVNAVRTDTFLLYWASRVPGFKNLCSRASLGVCDVWTGLTLAGSRVEDARIARWLDELIFRSLSNPAAAAAALILIPTVDADTKLVWAETIAAAGDSEQAYKAARWGSLVYEGFFPMDVLRATAVADRSRFWSLWHRDVEPQRAAEALQIDTDVHLLWAAELLDFCSLNGSPLMERLMNEVAGVVAPEGAQLILDFLQDRRNKGGVV